MTETLPPTDPPALRRLGELDVDATAEALARRRHPTGRHPVARHHHIDRSDRGPTPPPAPPAALRLRARPRRAAGVVGDRGDPVPRRVLVDARRVDRGRGVLRRLRLPHHVAAARRARAAPAPSTWPRSGCGVPAAYSPRCSSCSRSSRCGRWSPGRTASSPNSAGTIRGRSSTPATGARSSVTCPTTPANRRCSAISGAWRSRSSSTCCGRWPSSPSPGPGSGGPVPPRSSARVALAAVGAMFVLNAAGPGPIGGLDRVNFLYLSTFTRGRWPAGRAPRRRSCGGRGGPARGARTPVPRPGRRRRPRPAGLHRRGRLADCGLRLPMAAPAGLPARTRRGDGRRPSGGRRDAAGARLAAARGHRPPQLRPVPVDVADLCVRRGDARFGRAVPRRDGGRDRVRRALLPLRRDAGAHGRAHPVVAPRRSRPPQSAGSGGDGRRRARRLLRGGRSVRPCGGRRGRGLRRRRPTRRRGGLGRADRPRPRCRAGS